MASLIARFDQYLATLQDDIAEDSDHWEGILFAEDDEEEHDDEESAGPEGRNIFLGHGRGQEWKHVEAFLIDHGLEVEAFETQPRAGKHIVEILKGFLQTACLAVLTLTGDDATPDGGKRARQNVVHEAGLFQGRLGFERVILLVEDGVEEFSNLSGLQEIRFPRGEISESLPELRRVLVREGLLTP